MLTLTEIFKQIVMEVATNNLAPNLEEKLADAGYKIYAWQDDNLYDVNLVNATNIAISSIPYDIYTRYLIKLPAKKLVDFDYIMKSIAKKDRIDSFYINLSKYMQKIMGQNSAGLDIYPTSYGIGVVSIYNRRLTGDIQGVKDMMDKIGLQYSNEYSEGGWVYRFKVSKNAKNMKILNDLGA